MGEKLNSKTAKQLWLLDCKPVSQLKLRNLKTP